MRRSVKILLVILLYALIGFSFFALIAYFKQIKIFTDINYQLYIGALCILLAIIDIIYLSKSEKKNDEDTVITEQLDDNEDINQDVDEIQSSENPCLQEVSHDEIHQTVNDEQMYFDCEDDFIDYQEEINEIDTDVDNKEIKKDNENTDVDDIEIDEKNDNVVEEPIKVNADLTETQIMYINKSDNSYINDKGMPQLMVTNEMSKDKINSYEQQYQKQKEFEEEYQRKVDEEEQMYLRLEKYENIIHILTIIIVLLVLANLALGAYYIYLRMF